MPEQEITNNGIDRLSEPEADAEAQKNDTDADVNENTAPESESEIDYERLVSEDMRALSEEFSDGAPIKVTDLKNPSRYGALRDLGLTPKEAYLASGGRINRIDNRSHLSSSVPRNMTAAFSEIPRAHLDMARELFSDLSDSEIRSLYKKVTQ